MCHKYAGVRLNLFIRKYVAFGALPMVLWSENLVDENGNENQQALVFRNVEIAADRDFILCMATNAF
jgi:hypothetical protein